MQMKDSEVPTAARRGARTMNRVCLCIAIIVCGLALRRFGHGVGLSPAFVKYGGSVLWGTMVFFLVAVFAARQPRSHITMMSGVIAICVELFRLVHTSWLDAFRLTITGVLLLGRVFSVWNIGAYLAGIVLGMALDRLAWSFRARDAHAWRV